MGLHDGPPEGIAVVVLPVYLRSTEGRLRGGRRGILLDLLASKGGDALQSGCDFGYFLRRSLEVRNLSHRLLVALEDDSYLLTRRAVLDGVFPESPDPPRDVD